MNHTIELGIALLLGIALAAYWPRMFKYLRGRDKAAAPGTDQGVDAPRRAGTFWQRTTLIGPLAFLALVVLGLALTVPRLILPVLAIFAIGGVVGLLALASAQVRPKQ